MKRRLDRCNKCGEPLRAGICSDEVNCLLVRMARAEMMKPPGPDLSHLPTLKFMAGRTHIGRMARAVLPTNGLREADPIDLAEFALGDVAVTR